VQRENIVNIDLYVIKMTGKVFPVHATKAYWGVEAYLHLFLISVVDGNGQYHL